MYGDRKGGLVAEIRYRDRFLPRRRGIEAGYGTAAQRHFYIAGANALQRHLHAGVISSLPHLVFQFCRWDDCNARSLDGSAFFLYLKLLLGAEGIAGIDRIAQYGQVYLTAGGIDRQSKLVPVVLAVCGIDQGLVGACITECHIGLSGMAGDTDIHYILRADRSAHSLPNGAVKVLYIHGALIAKGPVERAVTRTAGHHVTGLAVACLAVTAICLPRESCQLAGAGCRPQLYVDGTVYALYLGLPAQAGKHRTAITFKRLQTRVVHRQMHAL